jgi:glutaredoxin
MHWSWLKRRWRQSGYANVEIVMYTRQGCHLCEEAWQLLERERQRHAFTLRQIDVDSDPQLQREYGECVPVVTVDGRVRFRGRINPVLLRRLLVAPHQSEEA